MNPLIKTSEDFWNIVFGFVFIGLFALLYAAITRTWDIPHSIGVFDFSLLSLSTYRIIRLVTYDKITDFIREYLTQYTVGIRKAIHSLLICSWCTGIWAALLVVTLYYTTDFGWLFLLVLSVSWIASFSQIITNTYIRYSEKAIVEKNLLLKDGHR